MLLSTIGCCGHSDRGGDGAQSTEDARGGRGARGCRGLAETLDVQLCMAEATFVTVTVQDGELSLADSVGRGVSE